MRSKTAAQSGAAGLHGNRQGIQWLRARLPTDETLGSVLKEIL